MDAIFILAAIAGIPVLLALLFRVSAVFLFLSVAAGSLMVTYLGDDAGLAVGMWVKGANSNLIAQLALLFIPVVLTLLILRKTMPKTAFLLHVPVVVATGLALAVIALPVLDSNMQQKIFADQYGNMLRESQDVIIGVAAASTLVLTWLGSRHKEDKKHKKHKKH